MWMFSCKNISEKISLSMDQTLPLYQRLMIRMHISMCNCCKAVEKQMKWLRQASRFSGDDAAGGPDDRAVLSNAAKQRIKAVLKNG